MKRILKVLIALAAGGCLLPSSAQGQSYTHPYTFITVAGTAGVTGGADGTNGAAQFSWPEGIAVDTNGNVYVVDNLEYTVRKVAPMGTNWVVTTIAGTAGEGGSADGTNGAARFYQPNGIALDRAGNLYVADSGNNTIREITPAGTNWVVTTIAGTANSSGGDDGTNQAALFKAPSGIAVDTNGNVFVADASTQTIRELTPAGTNWVVTTIAGTVGSQGSADGTNQAAKFYGPTGLTLDGAGNLYVADASNDTIRKLTPVGTNWMVTTIAGLPQAIGYSDGTGLNARFDLPSAIAADANGFLYVADTYNATIRILMPVGSTNWSVLTLAGTPEVPGDSDGIVQHAGFNYPFGLAADAAGRLFVGDTLNGTIRLGWFTPVPDVAIRLIDPVGMVVSWVGTPFFTLQTNADLRTGDWEDFGGTVLSVSGTNSVALPSVPSPLFFRLRD